MIFIVLDSSHTSQKKSNLKKKKNQQQEQRFEDAQQNKCFLEIGRNSGKHMCWSYIPPVCNFIQKEIHAQVFPCSDFPHVKI